MDALQQFSIPIRGLKLGVHQFDFQVDRFFFEQFEASLIKEGDFQVQMDLDKRSDMLVLVFDINGTVKTDCDRCLEKINLPIDATHQLLVKFAEEASEDADIVYINLTESSLNVAKYIYDFINLSLPLIKTYACEEDDNAPCNEEMLKYLNPKSTETPNDTNPIWDALKDLKKNN